ncbi:putative PEP-binding protein [Brevibacillus gelatini]
MELRLSLSGEQVNQFLVDKFSGVGLIRSEYLLRIADQHITMSNCQEVMKSYLNSIAEKFYPKPVWYRTIELWSDEANTLVGNDLVLDEPNPMVGLRGLRRAFETESTFEIELRIVKEVAEKWGNLHILFPFVGDVEELKRGIDVLEKVKWPNRFGNMLEIPSAVLDAGEFVKVGSTNLMVGMNDLSCLMLGAARVSGYDNKLHKALWWAIDYISSNVKGIEWGIAGNLNKEVLREAEARNVPYVSLHYSDLNDILNINKEYLPEIGLVRQTKINTRSRIREYNIQRVLKEIQGVLT